MLVLLLLVVAVLVISGCTQQTKEDKAGEDKAVKPTDTATEDKTTGDEAAEDFTVKNIDTQESDLFYSQSCPSGQAVQSFDLNSQEPGCVSLPSVSSSGATVLESVWRLLIGGEESQIGNGDAVELQAGEGIALSKEGNTVTIASTVSEATTGETETEPAASGATSSGSWTLSIPALKAASSSSISIADGSTLKIKGSGDTSVSLDTKLRELTVSSPAYVWKIATSFFGAGAEIKSGDTLRILGGGATSVSADSSGKTITVTTPEVKQYQYRTVSAWCEDSGNENFWVVEDEDTGIDVSCTDWAGRGKLTAECTEGKIINYGGLCQSSGSNRNAIQWLGPTGDFSSGEGYIKTWSDLPTISEITLLCKEDLTVLMHTWITCVREKP